MDDQALRDFFKFEDADLAANRSGRLSDKQQKALKKRDQKYRKLGIGCGIGSLVAALVLLTIIIVRGWIGTSILEELAALVWAGVGGYLLYLQFFKPASTKNVLKKAAGPARIAAVERQSGNQTGAYTGHELHCGDEKFDLDEIPAHLLVQGDIYAVYFIVVIDKDEDETAGIPWVKEILSMEWLSKGP